MSKVQYVSLLDSLSEKEFILEASRLLREIVTTVNGQIEFDKNFLSQTVEVDFTAANTDKAVSHNLGRVINKYIIVKKDVSCDIYDGNQDSTKSTIFLKSTVAPASVTIVLF